MSTLLVDSQPAPASEQRPADASAGPPGDQTPPAAPAGPLVAAPVDQSCAQCGAAMALGQDWCLQCGAGAPGSIGSPPWRSAATIIIATVLLALGAAAAGYAALSKKPHKAGVVTTTIAQAPPAATTTPTPITPGTPTTITPVVPPTAVKPPKIPLTPPVVTPTVPSTSGSTPQPTSTTPTSTTPSTPNVSSEPTPLLLDTNAASTYNPYNYPATDFGDPSLTIDGDTSTGWTAQVEPATAPKMAEGVLIDLKGHKKLASVKLASTSPGMTVQFYGANGASAPASITDPAWVPLSHSQVLTKKHTRIKLHHPKKAFSFVVLWISQAPAAALGTPAAPGHVSVNELELFPAG
ncbi:MAG TPA: hypothetical protein VII03_00550 [Solirubrobacteraceae bacterium]